ncbi:class I SAM-dependent methyltransferase [Candidatus Fermentibacteria bacterium]|nr:class I SAM-dependent methyltransferase [Candidatus Fermentibacteria bacterium]
MPTYEEFAEIYANGDYPAYSAGIAELLPTVLERFNAAPRTLLDVCCGEGTFAATMASRGIKVTGVDASARMVHLARVRAAMQGVSPRLCCHDMRDLPFAGEFDLVTCWYDSLNYLLTEDDLFGAFQAAHRALAPGGIYAFDVNTLYGLAVNWRRSECLVQRDDGTVFEIHRPRFDFETAIAALRITAFIREGAGWRRVEEEHRERGYRLEIVRALLARAGFDELGIFANLRNMAPPSPESGRAFFFCRKPADTPGV